MRRAILCAVLVMVSVSVAFAGATEDLFNAAKDKNTTPKMIQTLINAGADVNATGENGVTALMFAAGNSSNPEVIRTLLNAGADIFAKDNTGKTALDYAYTDEVKRLILNSAQ